MGAVKKSPIPPSGLSGLGVGHLTVLSSWPVGEQLSKALSEVFSFVRGLLS